MDREPSGSKEINRPNSFDDHSSSLDESETRITIGPSETAELKDKSNGAVDESTKVIKKEEGNIPSCVIDVNKSFDSVENRSCVGEGERICRICHLNAKEYGKGATDLMEIGCGCKGELGIAHTECAEAWFRVKGHRMCEICGEAATNIKGVSDNRFMEEWSEMGTTDASTNSSAGNRRCLNGQPLCNFLMACLVIAFVLPWFFRVNMF